MVEESQYRSSADCVCAVAKQKKAPAEVGPLARAWVLAVWQPAGIRWAHPAAVVKISRCGL
jgi:hypothetical protein